VATATCFGILIVVGALMSPTRGLAQSATPGATPSSADGRDIYLRDCAYCHGTRAEGTNRGPELRSVGAASVDFMLSTGRMPIDNQTDDPLRRPPEYTPVEIGAIVGYLSTLQVAGPPIPAVDSAGGSLSDGLLLYTDNCAACHSSAGIGGALTDGRIAPSLKPSTSLQVAEAIRTGPGTMPVFGPTTLSDVQVNAIARYVEYIHHPYNRGGADLGAIGPITEGAVAALLGLVVLLVITRWIGTTADE
jgi:ubiquinol-cytochrome c reductase cytochrome c subunit